MTSLLFSYPFLLLSAKGIQSHQSFFRCPPEWSLLSELNKGFDRCDFHICCICPWHLPQNTVCDREIVIEERSLLKLFNPRMRDFSKVFCVNYVFFCIEIALFYDFFWQKMIFFLLCLQKVTIIVKIIPFCYSKYS